MIEQLTIIFYWRSFAESNLSEAIKDMHPQAFIKSIGFENISYHPIGPADCSEMVIKGDKSLLEPYKSFIKIDA